MFMNNNPFPTRSELANRSYKESIIEQIKEIDVEKINYDNVDFKSRSEIKEEQKVYFWARIYTNEEILIEPNTEVTMTYQESGEKLKTTFICYAKKGLQKDQDENLVNYNSEDDKKILCLMVDSERINKNSEDIPFIRTLFRIGRHYCPQILRHSDLTISDSQGRNIEYYDIDF
jgi:hypothetical protein